MAKRKIVWTNRAIKRLYGILESSVEKEGDKNFAEAFWKKLIVDTRNLLKYYKNGLLTSYGNVCGLKGENYLMLYEEKGQDIIIHTINTL